MTRRRAAGDAAGALLALTSLAACASDVTLLDAALDAADGIDARIGVDAGPPVLDAPLDAPVDGGRPDAGPCELPPLPPLGLENLGVFRAPIYVAQAPGREDALFVVERRGTIRILRGGRNDVFLTIPVVSDSVEQGLLGLAFHPDYSTNGRFFVYYTLGVIPDSANIVAEYRVSASDPDVADPAEVRRLVETVDRRANHNGGNLQFGPDRMLYVGMGDEGGGGDTFRNSQNTMSLYGKLLRLDVDAAARNFAAAGNPFEAGGGLPQILHFGLRNPWRWSFDRETGDLWIGDVGQASWEEIDFVAIGTGAPRNFGWPAYEGLEVFRDMDVPLVAVHHEPIFILQQSSDTELLRGACAITGGYVYRGTAMPAYRGVYLFGDYCSPDRLAAFRRCPDGSITGVQRVTGAEPLRNLASFGEDRSGELYLVEISGVVFRIVPP